MVNNPFANIFVALILLVTSLMEAWETLFDDVGEMSFGDRMNSHNYGTIVSKRLFNQVSN